jgi:hypothetical protein
MAEEESSNLLVYLVIGIIALALIFVIIKTWFVGTQSALGEQECWNSVDQHAKIIALSKNDVAIDIKCPTRNDTIPAKMQPEQVNAKIADAWAACWSEWHRGQAILFNKDGVYCHVCQIFTFEDRASIEGLPTYLKTHNVPSQGISYFAYLTPFSTQDTAYLEDLNINVDKEKAKALDQKESMPIEGKPFAIIIVYAKGQSVIQQLLSGNKENTILAGTGLLIGGISVGSGAAALIPIVGLTGPVGIGLVVAAAAVTAGAGVISVIFMKDKQPQWMAVSSFKPYDENIIKDLKCTMAPVKQK